MAFLALPPRLAVVAFAWLLLRPSSSSAQSPTPPDSLHSALHRLYPAYSPGKGLEGERRPTLLVLVVNQRDSLLSAARHHVTSAAEVARRLSENRDRHGPDFPIIQNRVIQVEGEPNVFKPGYLLLLYVTIRTR